MKTIYIQKHNEMIRWKSDNNLPNNDKKISFHRVQIIWTDTIRFQHLLINWFGKKTQNLDLSLFEITSHSEDAYTFFNLFLDRSWIVWIYFKFWLASFMWFDCDEWFTWSIHWIFYDLIVVSDIQIGKIVRITSSFEWVSISIWVLLHRA